MCKICGLYGQRFCPDSCRGWRYGGKSISYDILWPDHIQWQPPTDKTFTEFWVVSIEHLRRLWHADRGHLLLRTPGPVPLGLAYVLLVETNPFPNLSLFYRTMLFEYPSVLSRFCFRAFSDEKKIEVFSTLYTMVLCICKWKGCIFEFHHLLCIKSMIVCKTSYVIESGSGTPRPENCK